MKMLLSLRVKNCNAKHFKPLTRIAILSIGISGVENVTSEREKQLLIWELEKQPKVFMVVAVVAGNYSRVDYSN